MSNKASVSLGGALTALVTPFRENGEVDTDAVERLVSWQVDRGIDGLAPCGTTGEGATLTDEEQGRVIGSVVRAAAGRVPVVAGCGSNDTRRTVAAAQRAAAAGADALLVVSPYYNKPNRSGMLAHYEAVCAATELPVVVYNVPGRTGQNLGTALILELAGLPGVVAVKEASADLEQLSSILAERPAGFAVLSGDDSLTLPALSLGAEGVISVVSNQAPAEMAALVAAGVEGAMGRARELHYRLLPLMRANFAETNPVAVKAGMARLGLCREAVRSPLGAISAAAREEVHQALARAALEGAPS